MKCSVSSVLCFSTKVNDIILFFGLWNHPHCWSILGCGIRSTLVVFLNICSTFVVFYNTLSQYFEYNVDVQGHYIVTLGSQPKKKNYLNKGLDYNLIWSKSNTSLSSTFPQYLVGWLSHLGWNYTLKKWLNSLWHWSISTWALVLPL